MVFASYERCIQKRDLNAKFMVDVNSTQDLLSTCQNTLLMLLVLLFYIIIMYRVHDVTCSNKICKRRIELGAF